jgi:heterodisulfide reductase subunit B
MKEVIFPGCSLTGYAKDYYISTKLVLTKLDRKLEEIPEWCCCGATILPSSSSEDFEEMVERNIEGALGMGAGRIIVPCSSCYINLLKFSNGRVEVLHLLHYLLELKEKIKEKIRDKIGLRLIAYYGCQTVRPFIRENPDNPTSMDEILSVIGAEVINFPFKAKCCGGVFTQIDQKIGEKIVYGIFSEFLKEVDMVVTVCPLCRLNLETVFYAKNLRKPVLYLTQIIGLSLGIESKELMIDRTLTGKGELKKCV